MRVAVVQSGGCGEVDMLVNLDGLAKLVTEAAEPEADLVVLPELSTTPFFAGAPTTRGTSAGRRRCPDL